MLPPEEIVGQVELNPIGLALYRLDRNREISITEAQRLVEIGWGKPDVVCVFTPDGVPTIFECISLTLEGALELADMDQATASLTGKWGERREISGFARAVLEHDTKAVQQLRAQPKVFSRRIFNITFQEGVDCRYNQSARGWYPGNIEDYQVEELKLRSYYDRAKLGTETMRTVQDRIDDEAE